jgi:hypothetical protein
LIFRLLLFAFAAAALPLRALAGPPYDTDDPDPTDYRNYEIYAGITTHRDLGDSTSELPFLEINYGLMPNVQFSVHAGDAEQTTPGANNAYGFEDFQMGLKVRFIQENAYSPQVSFYPQVTFATGAPGVGAGHGTLFLPVWAQKTIGRVTVFGGGGYYFDRDDTGTGDWQAGIAATYQLDRDDNLGMEFTRTTLHDDYEQSDVGFGYIHSLGKVHALLFSAGRSFGPQPHFRGYAAYGWFLGPHDSSTRSE